MSKPRSELWRGGELSWYRWAVTFIALLNLDEKFDFCDHLWIYWRGTCQTNETSQKNTAVSEYLHPGRSSPKALSFVFRDVKLCLHAYRRSKHTEKALTLSFALIQSETLYTETLNTKFDYCWKWCWTIRNLPNKQDEPKVYWRA